MATQPNTALTSDWSLLVSSGLEFTLTLPGATPVRLCAQDAAVAPVSFDNGHTIMADSRESWNRALAGPGYIYARALNGAAQVELTTWTPS
jgi:hypothetical protein